VAVAGAHQLESEMPTFTESHVKVTVIGDAWLATETWQFGVNCRFGPGGEPTNAGLQAMADALVIPTNTFLTSSGPAMSSSARITAIKVALVDATGHYPAPSVPGIATFGVPTPGPSGAGAIPQATIAVTLVSDVPRGRGSRGRFYLPPCMPAIQTDGRITAAAADSIESAAKTWLNAIKGNVIVSEILVMSGLGAGTSGVVKSIGVGRVVDTMRSRRRNLLEARTPLVI
jgi:hypothetical protein